ncbi:hypothetical protein L7F22_031733 [Adiantum nelumboides]|nr:hypothetical protein [Adiantum nelumboides]
MQQVAAAMESCWLRVSAFLLSWLLARTLCLHIAGWLAYYWVMRPLINQPSTTGSTMLKGCGLQVIVCGFPRTGTMSLMRALQMLGLPCFHGIHLAKPSNAKRFIKAFKYGNPKDWENLLNGYASIADFPGTCSYKELMTVFPSAKIILNIRDPDKWYRSHSRAIGLIGGDTHRIYKFITPWISMCGEATYYKKCLNDKPHDKEACIKAYLHHICDVKEYVAPDNLLVYDLEKEEGWSSLCEFLNVLIPNAPFPKINDARGFSDLTSVDARIYTMVYSLFVASMLCIFVYVV